MKKHLLPLLFVISSLVLSNESYATHLNGGQITWSCLSNGNFVLELKLYRDCSGANLTFNNQTVMVKANSINQSNQPKTSTNAVINHIIVKPDSARFLAMNNGSIDPNCDGVGFNCANRDQTVNVFYYRSDPIQIKGIPPAAGWDFEYSANCCRAIADNINTNGDVFALRSTMYRIPIPGSSPVQYYPTDACRDNSPQFAEESFPRFCQSSHYRFSTAAIDSEIDSLVYSMSAALSDFGGSIHANTYLNGYSPSSPFPGTTLSSLNENLQINSRNGDLTFKVSSNTGKYQLGTQIDAYRNGAKIASVHREIPAAVVLCPVINGGSSNTQPVMNVNAQAKDTLAVSINVGQSLSQGLVITDNDLIPNQNPPFQDIIVSAFGSSVAADLSSSTVCNDPPCLTFSPTASLDSLSGRYEIVGSASLGISLNWSPAANHLDNNGGPKTHYVHLNMQDDHCPLPGIDYKTIAITVFPLGTELDEQEKSMNQFTIYPNPNTGSFNIISENGRSIKGMKIRDVKGSVLIDQNYSNTFNLLFEEDLPAALYFVEIMDETGSLSQHKLIVR